MRRTQRNINSQASYQANGYQDPPYEEEAQESYNEEPYDEDQLNGEDQPYDGPLYEQEPQEPEVISTSQAVNLTCTLAAFSGLFAFFLYVADRRSDAVRRISVQSIALTGGFLSVSVVLLIVGTLFRIIPFLGIIIAVIFWLLFAALLLATVYLKVQMMLYAYRGFSYQLPVIGGYVRRFE